MTTPTRGSLAALKLVFLAFLASAVAVRAYDEGGRRQDLRALANRIAGGASLLNDLDRSDAADRLNDAARHFERIVEEARGEGHMYDDWSKVRDAFRRVSRSGRSGDPRMEFILDHLENDIEAGDQIVGRGDRDEDSSTSSDRASLIRSETCLGDHRVGPHPCPSPREAITFRIPREATVLKGVSGEWRDFGRGGKALVYLNDRAIWESDVARDWDSDGRNFNLRVPRGSTITLVSKNGDPIWIRRFEIEFGRESDGGSWW